MSPLMKLRNAGFKVVRIRGAFEVSPGDLVTETVTRFLREHGEEIGRELDVEHKHLLLMNAEREANRIIQQFITRASERSMNT